MHRRQRVERDQRGLGRVDRSHAGRTTAQVRWLPGLVTTSDRDQRTEVTIRVAHRNRAGSASKQMSDPVNYPDYTSRSWGSPKQDRNTRPQSTLRRSGRTARSSTRCRRRQASRTLSVGRCRHNGPLRRYRTRPGGRYTLAQPRNRSTRPGHLPRSNLQFRGWYRPTSRAW